VFSHFAFGGNVESERKAGWDGSIMRRTNRLPLLRLHNHHAPHLRIQ
jgi:hypothetical protein